MSTTKRVRAAAVIGALSLGALLSAPAVAGAADAVTPRMLPGDDGSGTVVITDSDKVRVVVESVDLATGAVAGTVTNTSGTAMNCTVPGANNEKFDHVVAEAGLVALAFDHYRNNISIAPGDFQSGAGAATIIAPLGSLYEYAGSLGDAFGGANELRTRSDRARIAGHFGTIKPLTVPANSTAQWTSKLSTPTTGVRSDFDAAALFYCTDTATKKAYVFAGDKEGNVPALETRTQGSAWLPLGSIGSSK